MNTKIEKINIIGIAIRTTNENHQSVNDLQKLWGQFMSESIMNKIPNKVSNDIYSIYTNYESDHTKPYTTIIGCAVSDTKEIPEGMVSLEIQPGNYKKYTAKGNINQGVVFETWMKIWNEDIKRAYSADFEVYGQKASNPEDAEVDIFVAI